MLHVTNDQQVFNPSVFGLKDKPLSDVPSLNFETMTDGNQYIADSEGNEKRWQVHTFKVFDQKSTFIGWLDVFLGGLGGFSYTESKPDNPKEIYIFNELLFAGPLNSDEELIELAKRCAHHYHDYLHTANSSVDWSQINFPLEERADNLQIGHRIS